MRNFLLVALLLLCGITKNIAQTITANSAYAYSSNIDYKLYQVTSNFTTTNCIGVMGLTLSDAGGDNLPTTLTAITFSISSLTGNAVREAALYTNGVRVGSYVAVANGTTSITFSAASLASVADGASVSMELKVTFKTTMIDHQQMQFTVSFVTASAAGSQFGAPDGGGATSSVAANINKINVIADRYRFLQQPSDVFAGQIIMPSVMVAATDVNKNVDSDYVSLIKLNITNPTPSCDTLSGNLVTAVSGIATFPALTPNVAEYNISLTATGILTSVTSNAFDVNSAAFKTLISYNFSDSNSVADAGTNTDYLTRNITVTGTNPIGFGSCGCIAAKGLAAYTTGWTNGSGTKYWQMDFNTSGYWDLQVNSRQRSSPTGPRDFKVEYKIGTGSWQSLGTVLALRDSFRSASFLFPSIDTPARVYVRWIMNSNTNVSGGIVDDAGDSYIDDIGVSGIGITLAKQLYYRSKKSGTLESSCSWETADSAAGPWSQAKGSPDFSAYNITIRSGDTISINQSINLDQIYVDTGASLILNSGTLHILNTGKVSGLIIKGAFVDNATGKDGITFSSDASWQLGSSATFIKTGNSNAVPYRTYFYTGMSNIPSTANWIIRYTGSGSPSFTTDTTFYPNLTFESTSGLWDPGATAGSYFTGASNPGAYATVKGNLDIGGTNNLGTVKISNISPNTQPFLVQGNTIIRAGNELNNTVGLNYGTGFEVKGNVTVDGTLSVNGGGKGILKFSGATLQTLSGAGIINLQNFTVANTGAGVSITRAITISGIDSLIQGLQDPGVNTLTLNGPIVRNAGSINAKLNTTIFSGTSSQTIPANTFLSNTLKNLTINNNVSLAGQDSITSTLSLTGTSHTFSANGYLTLKSTATSTANVALVSNGNTVAGDVIVERYISAKRAWRFLSVPTNSTQTIKDAWQEGAATSSANPVQGYGTQVTDNTGTWAANGFDYYSPDGPSVKKYNSLSNTWVGVTTTNNIPAGSGLIKSSEGLMTFVRGDRRSTGIGSTAYATILRSKGPLYIGTQPTILVTAGQSISIGNPYASALDVRQISKPGVSDFFIVWDPYLANSNGTGFGAFQYLYLDNSGANYYALPGGGSYPSVDMYGNAAAPSNYIESGQAFFVQSSTGGTLTFNENAKAGANTNPLVFRSAPKPEQHLRTNLYAVEADSSTTLLDATLNDYAENYSNDVDQFDAIKAANFTESLSIKNGDKLLAIERRHTITLADTIALNMLKMKVKSYKFEIIGKDFTQPGLTAFLEDSYFNTRTAVNLNGNTVFNFNVINVPGSWNPTRFRIVFAAPESGLLPVTFSVVKAYQQNKNISVDWKIENEKNIKQYIVEKSANGQQFTNQISVTAKNNSNGSAAYQWIDENPLPNNNYYRIESIDLNGEIQYSNIVKVFTGNSLQQISVYPNPIVNSTLNLQLTNQPSGIYSLRLLNNLGQVIQIKQINHTEGSSAETMKLNNTLPKGTYQLEVTKPDYNKTNINVLY